MTPALPETPRTDAIRDLILGSRGYSWGSEIACERMFGHARTLERELTATRSELAALRGERDSAIEVKEAFHRELDSCSAALGRELELTRKLREEVEALRGFANAVMKSWPDGDVDGGHLQDLAEKFDLLKPVVMNEPCGPSEHCMCYDCDATFPTTCYRKTPLLEGPLTEPKGAGQ